MRIVGRGDARAWGVGVTLLALGIAASAWWLSRGEEPAPIPRDDDAREEAPDETNPFEALAPAGSIVRGSDPLPGGVLRLLLQTPAGGRVCTIRGPEDGLPLAAATCATIAVPLDDTAIAMGERDVDVPLIHAGDVWIDGVAVWRGGAMAAFAASPSSVAVLRAHRGREIVRIRDGATSHVEAPAPNGPGTPELVWSQLLFLERSEDGPDTRAGEGGNDRLYARPATWDGPTVFVGEVPDAIERIRGCKSDGALAVVVDGPVVHGVKRVAVTFRDDAIGEGPESLVVDRVGWTPPVVAEAAVFEYQLSCRGPEATLTWLEPGIAGADARTIVQIRCTPAACERAQSRATFAGSDPMVGDLAGKALLVWAARDGTHARLAPLTEIDRREGLGALPQPPGSILARHLFIRRGAAIVLYRTRAGLFALRIDAAGRFAPLPVREHTALSAP